MSIKEKQVIDRDSLNRAYLSKSATGTQILAGSVNVLGNIKAGALSIKDTDITGKLDVSGDVTANKFNGDGTGLTGVLLKSGGTMTGSISFNNIVSGSSAAITWSGLTDTHSIYSEEYGGGEKVRLVISSEDNGDDDYVLFRNKNGGTTKDVLAIHHSSVRVGSYLKALDGLDVTGDITTSGHHYLSGNSVIRGGGTNEWFKIEAPNKLYLNYDNATKPVDIGKSGNTLTLNAYANATIHGTSTLKNNVTIEKDLDVQGELKTSGANEFPDALLASKSTSDWSGGASGSISFDPAQKPFGVPTVGSLKLSATGDDYYKYHAAKIPVAPSEWITFSVYNFATTTGKTVQIYINFLKADGNSTSTGSHAFTTTTASTSWKRLSVTGQAPADATQCRIRIDNDGGSGSIMYFSGFQVERGRAMTTFKPYTGGEEFSLAKTNTQSYIQSDLPIKLTNDIIVDGVSALNGNTLITGKVGINQASPSADLES